MERGAQKTSACKSSWSWALRKKRSLEQAAEDPLQLRITDYWNIVDDLEQLQYKNEKLSMLVRELEVSLGAFHQNPIKSKFSNLLQILISNAEQNCGKYPTKRKHSDTIKKFATAFFLYAGPLAYEFLQQNVPQALPCVRTIQSTIHSEYKRVDEGCFRFDELKGHIGRYKAPAFISISEDATRIIGRVEYDSATNRCVGFVLPLDENGLPKENSCLADSFSVMENMFLNYPIAKKCLRLHGTTFVP